METTYTCDTRYEGPPPPKGWRIKCMKVPKSGDTTMNYDGEPLVTSHDFQPGHVWPILERIEPVRLTKWVNVHPGGVCGWTLYETEGDAKKHGEPYSATAVPVTIKYPSDK